MGRQQGGRSFVQGFKCCYGGSAAALEGRAPAHAVLLCSKLLMERLVKLGYMFWVGHANETMARNGARMGAATLARVALREPGSALNEQGRDMAQEELDTIGRKTPEDPPSQRLMVVDLHQMFGLK